MRKRISASFILLTLVFFAILVGYSHFYEADRESFRQRAFLIDQNTQRIKDIQESRMNSCKQTYEGIRKVFIPFFPPQPRSKEQMDDVKKFNNIINELKEQCIHQIKVKPKKSNDG